MLDDIKEYLSLNLSDYENIDVNFEINKFILLCAVALCFVAFYVNYRRSILVSTVRQLIRHGAKDEESARTLSELGLADSRGIRKAIFEDSRLRRMITIVGEVRPTYEEYMESMKKKEKPASPDPLAARIYIPAEAQERAKHVYNTYDTSLVKTTLSCIFIFSLAVCVTLILPSLLSVIDEAMAQ